VEDFLQKSPACIARHAAREFAPGVLRVNLSGPVGAGESISLAAVRRQVISRRFGHVHFDINSTGGSVSESEKIFHYFRALPVPVSGRAVGQCLSAALTIFLAADLRIAAPQCEFLLHGTAIGRETLPEGRLTANVLKERAASLDLIDQSHAEMFATRTGTPADWFAVEATNEDPLDMADAIATGLVHEFEGVTWPVDAAWPAWISKARADRQAIYFPHYLETPNYFAACRAAATLYGGL
jgi:ATP-dependent Clp protease protease subunit